MLAPDEPLLCDEASGDALEIKLEFELADADAFELVVARSDDGEERTPIRYTDDDQLIVDRDDSSLSDAASAEPQSIDEAPQTDDGVVNLRVLVDASVVEVFVNGRTCVSSRIYPTRPDSTGVALRAIGGNVDLHSGDVWTLNQAAVRNSEAEASFGTEAGLD